MCLITSVLNLTYIVLLLVGFGLSIASLFLPSWSKIHVTREGIEDGTVTKGLLFGCDGTTLNRVSGWQACANSQNLDTAEWISVLSFFLCYIFCVLAIVWSFVNCLACCCRSCLTEPLAIFSGMAFLFVTVAIAVFGFSHQPNIGPIPASLRGVQNKIIQEDKLGASFWLGVLSSACLLGDTIVGIVLAKCVKVPLA